MQAYCPVSFALKLAGFCLLVGVVVGAWLSMAMVSAPESQPNQPGQPDRARTAEVVEAQP